MAPENSCIGLSSSLGFYEGETGRRAAYKREAKGQDQIDRRQGGKLMFLQGMNVLLQVVKGWGRASLR